MIKYEKQKTSTPVDWDRRRFIYYAVGRALSALVYIRLQALAPRVISLADLLAKSANLPARLMLVGAEQPLPHLL